jgi:uncharacterized protein DUF2569
MNPDQVAEQARENISRLDDECLLRMLDSPDGEFTPEAMAFARAELERRGGRLQVAERVPEYAPGSAPQGGTDSLLKDCDRIAGWLILPTVGLVFQVGIAAIQALSGAWGFLKAPGIGKAIALAFLMSWLVLVILVAALFVARHRWAPRAYIGLLAANLSLVLAYSAHIEDKADNSTAPAGLGAVVSCAVWIPYFLTSKRVKLTFVR